MNQRKKALMSLQKKIKPWGYEIVDVINRLDEIVFVLEDGREASFNIGEALMSMDELQAAIEQRLIPFAPE